VDSFDRVMEFIFRWEGGYVNDPDDPGGETKFGISKRANPDVNIKDLTQDEAKELYRGRYWKPVKGSTMPFIEALTTMDFAVHSGVQTALGYWNDARDVRSYVILRTDYLRTIRGRETGEFLFNRYGRGWMARINALHEQISIAEATPDVELIQIYYGPKVLELRPEKVTVGRTNSGGTKFMVRLY